MIVEDLLLEKCLSKGKRGDVFLTSKKNSSIKYITKRVEKNEKTSNDILNEKEILKELNNDKIIKILEIKETNKYYFILKEYCNGGSLNNCLEQYFEKYEKSFSEKIIQHLMKQIIECIYYIHGMNIMHRDINLNNILIVFETEEDQKSNNLLKAKIKLNDFCYATKISKELHKTIIGSPFHFEPGILNTLNNTGNLMDFQGYDEKADIWALGTICYQLIVGKTLFKGSNIKELMTVFSTGKYSVPLSCSQEIVDFIKNMLQFDTNDRLNAEELLKHPFLANNVNEFHKIDINKEKENIDTHGLNISFFKIKNEDNIKNINDFNNDNNFNDERIIKESNYDDYQVEEK